MKRNLKASVPSYSPIFLEDVKIHICFRVFKEQSDNGYTKHTDTKLKNMYSFYKHVRLISVASLVSNIFSLSLSLKLAILLFVRHNIRIFDFSTFHNIMSFLFDMIFFEFLNTFFLQQSIILCTFNI